MAFTSLNNRTANLPAMEAFADHERLQAQLRTSLASHPSLEPLFKSVNTYVAAIKAELQAARRQLETARHHAPLAIKSEDDPVQEPASKKRRLESTNGASEAKYATSEWLQLPYSLRVSDVSFSTPVRKKLHVEIVAGDEGGIRGIDTKTGSVEVSLAWSDVDQIISTPVPEKASPAHFLLFVPRTPALDTLVLTLNDTPAKGIDSRLPVSVRAEETTYPEYMSVFLHSINQVITKADPEEFLSNQVQPHRSSEKPAHCKAFRGSKEGFLLLLKPGILFGFKKPILWFPFDRILSVSYQSVLQRTFNMVVAAEGVEDGKTEREEYEFSMLDQVDFAGIDEYVKRHGLHDESLAESRKAKVYGVNDPRSRKKKDEAGGEGGEELVQEGEQRQLTEQELQDVEDEEEEDFEPDDDLSDGSGEDSEEEGGEGGGGYDEDDDGEDGEEEEEEEEE